MATYRLRAAGSTFLSAALAVILVPASLPLAAAIASLGGLLVVAREPKLSRQAVAASSLAALIVGVYTLRSRGSITVAAGSALLAGFLAFAVARGAGRAEVRLIAIGELFCYLSLAGVMLGIDALNENREFLGSTTGGERFSFVFASSPAQAAMVSGATLILAVTTPVRMGRIRKVALVVTAGVLVYGANYRYVVVLTAVVLLAWWLTRRQDRARRSLAPLALAFFFLPIWWPTVSGVVEKPLVIVVTNSPGLGSRNASVTAAEEVRTLNQRTTLWSANFDLLRRSGARELLTGYGQEGGDSTYAADVLPVVRGDFRRLDTISSHNTALEIQRRAGLPLGLMCVGLLVIFLRRVRRWPCSGAYAVAVALVVYGSTDISSLPLASMPLIMLLTAVLPAVLSSGPRSDVGPIGTHYDYEVVAETVGTQGPIPS